MTAAKRLNAAHARFMRAARRYDGDCSTSGWWLVKCRLAELNDEIERADEVILKACGGNIEMIAVEMAATSDAMVALLDELNGQKVRQ